MERRVPVFSKQSGHSQRRESRRSVREAVNLRIVVADNAGLASGEAFDLTTRGCGLRLTKPLSCGQYLTLKLYPGGGMASVICDLVRVQWAKEGRAGIAFLSMSLENEFRLHRLCHDRVTFQVED
ncbi:MAG: hypothetical protein A2V62_06470 [Nitrospirae bacterium RBG_19FT_COMBO_58_9]|nr:MAG: hypothetical protein A2V62_06470 [Nitrospirae bacterium RBG_19FT_COMBO_58_9]